MLVLKLHFQLSLRLKEYILSVVKVDGTLQPSVCYLNLTATSDVRLSMIYPYSQNLLHFSNKIIQMK